MSNTDIDELNSKVEILTEQNNRILAILGNIFIEADYLTKTKGLNENTISRNNRIEKFNEIGKRKLLIKLESVTVIKNRKRSQKGR
ncbi:MAG TPA: hypothetical protein VGD05_07075 [Pyrinomonadaceae bacterium]|jgi:hypothetical protein